MQLAICNMKKLISAGNTSLLLCICFTCTPAHKEDSAKDIIKQQVRDRIDNGYSVGTAIVFIEDGKEEYFFYGYGNAARKEVINKKSVFEIGSVTKTFTALLLADLVKKGRITLDDPVDRFFPDSVRIPDYFGRKITFADLATHRSGLPREPIGFNKTDLNNPYIAENINKLYAGLKSWKLKRGANRYEYSNLGIEVLGQTLALISGKSFDQMLQETICGPLQMNETGTKNGSPFFTTGHMGTIPVAHWDLNALEPAGGIRSNAEDLARYMKAQMGLSVSNLKPAMDLTQIPRATIGTNTRIGLVWNITKVKNDEIISHSGATGGYRAFVAFSQKTKKGIILLNNSGQQQDDLGMYFFDQTAKISTLNHPILVSVVSLRANVGSYRLPAEVNGKILDQELDVKLENNQLFVKVGGLPYIPIYPKSESVFFTKGPEAYIEFKKNTSGVIDKMLLPQGTQTLTAIRIFKTGAVRE